MNRTLRALQTGAVLPVLAAMLVLATGPIAAAGVGIDPSAGTKLTKVAGFGANPSDLDMYLYAPARLAQHPALLVALHACGSSAQTFYDGGARDFVAAADQYGYLVLFPEATREGGCFDVSSPQALLRGGGSDPVGIMSMVSYTRRTYRVDPHTIVVTGASSGALMTTVLAAEYPDVFTAAAAFSGAPAGCFATTDGSAWNSQCAGGQVTRTAQEWGDLARAMYPDHHGRYPRMQVWHDTADSTLAYANFGEGIKQWTNLSQLDAVPASSDNPEPTWTRTRYGNTSNTAPVEGVSVSGSGGALPLHLMAQYAIGFLELNQTKRDGEQPSSFQWNSTGALIAPKSDATHSIISVKDPSVVRYQDKWLVYLTTVNSAGRYSMAYLSFTDWADAGAATPYYLDQSAIGTGYRAAPQLFYFRPQRLWYLVYQSDKGASYSTTTDPTKPETWSATQPFFSGTPDIIAQNIGKGNWVDMWVICDEARCYLFSSDDNGHLYRSQTTLADFPGEFGDTVIALDSPASKFRLFEASNVYRVRGTDSYLLTVEASGSARYFRSWTSNRLDGVWTPLTTSQANPFAGAANVSFTGTPWTTSISHGEMIRDGYDQSLTIDPHHVRYLYQGVDPTVSTSYTFLPWQLGLLTQACGPIEEQ